MKTLAYLIPCFVALALSVSACTTGACFEETDPVVVTDMYSETTGALLKCDSVIVIGMGESKDTLLFKEKAVTRFSFSLDPTQNISKLLIKINNIKDTVTIEYTNYPHLISPDCGYTIYNDITEISATKNIIDNIRIENKSVTLDGQRNLCLYY